MPTIINSKKGRAYLDFEKRMPIAFFYVKRVVNVNLFSDTWENMWDVKYHNFGATTTGSFIMTTQLFRPLWKSPNLWNLWLPTHQTTPPPPQFNFASFPKFKMKPKGRYFENCLMSKGNHKRYSTALRKNTSTVPLKRGKNTMGWLYMSPGGLFR
jgi:hypothetical protein